MSILEMSKKDGVRETFINTNSEEMLELALYWTSALFKKKGTYSGWEDYRKSEYEWYKINHPNVTIHNPKISEEEVNGAISRASKKLRIAESAIRNPTLENVSAAFEAGNTIDHQFPYSYALMDSASMLCLAAGMQKTKENFIMNGTGTPTQIGIISLVVLQVVYGFLNNTNDIRLSAQGLTINDYIMPLIEEWTNHTKVA